MLTAAEYTCLQPLDGRVSGRPKQTMARLLDLPDEVLVLILKYFEVTAQHSPYLRRSVEVNEADSRNRKKLIALAKTCKALYKVATPILYDHRYVFLDMMPCEAYHIMDSLARLSFYKDLHHLICKLDVDIVTSFLICLSNAITSSTLRSLSLTIQGDTGPGTIDLHSLTKFPHLLGLELNTCGAGWDVDIVMKPLSNLPSLKDLQCGTNTFEEMTSLLSLASSDSLENLGIYCDICEDQFDDRELWTSSWKDKCMNGVRNLSILLGPHGFLPVATLTKIPIQFPSLDAFDINYEHGLPSERYHGFLSSHPMNTFIAISPNKIEDLRVLLLCIKQEVKAHARLQAIQIRLEAMTKRGPELTSSELIQLWNEARVAASASGVEFSPADLTEAVEGLLPDRRHGRINDIDSDEE
jgi:hypothetical protein